MTHHVLIGVNLISVWCNQLITDNKNFPNLYLDNSTVLSNVILQANSTRHSLKHIKKWTNLRCTTKLLTYLKLVVACTQVNMDNSGQRAHWRRGLVLAPWPGTRPDCNWYACLQLQTFIYIVVSQDVVAVAQLLYLKCMHVLVETGIYVACYSHEASACMCFYLKISYKKLMFYS